MENRLKYTVISSRKQYNEYCKALEQLVSESGTSKDKWIQKEIELLTLLIEKWDAEHSTFGDSDPIELLKYLMDEHNLKAKDLVGIMNVSKGMVSSIMNYRKGLSKKSIRKLASYFKLTQEAFNRPYKLVAEANRHYKNASMMNTRKNLTTA